MKIRKLYPSFYKRLNLQQLNFLSDIFWFVIIFYGFHLIGNNLGGYKLIDNNNFLKFKETQELLAHQILLSVSWLIINMLGTPVQTVNNTLHFAGGSYLQILRGCSGLIEIYKWIILMILFPGPRKHKLWYIPTGIIIMYIENILRILILAIILIHHPSQFEFMHIWVTRFFYYLVFFLLWVIWVEKFKKKHKEIKTNLKILN